MNAKLTAAITALLITGNIAAAPTNTTAAGMYPGMPVADIKASGYTICAVSPDETARCEKPGKPPNLYGQAVKSIVVTLKPPYAQAHTIEVHFKPNTKDCNKISGGKWDGINTSDCTSSLEQAITRELGETKPHPRHDPRRKQWHNCGRYIQALDNRSVLTFYDEPDRAEDRKAACANQAEEAAKQQQKQRNANNFINQMQAAPSR